MKRLLLGSLCLMLSCVALAAGPSEVRKQAQAGMLVTGLIEVTPEGKVKSFALDQQSKLPAPVVELLGENIPTWEFKPVVDDGKPVAAKAKMNLRIVAKRVDDQHSSISIEGAQFGENTNQSGETITRKTMEQPKYPPLEIASRVSGTVYLLLRVGRNGQVEDAAAEQVNLGVYASERDMERFRNDLADAALKAARQWTFNTPTVGKHINDDYWVARAPVAFNIILRGASPPHDEYGKWQSYIPGPRELVPWLDKSRLMSGSPDAAPSDGVYQVGQGLQLITPLAGA